jgi:hypothetical protein
MQEGKQKTEEQAGQSDHVLVVERRKGDQQRIVQEKENQTL